MNSGEDPGKQIRQQCHASWSLHKYSGTCSQHFCANTSCSPVPSHPAYLDIQVTAVYVHIHVAYATQVFHVPQSSCIDLQRRAQGMVHCMQLHVQRMAICQHCWCEPLGLDASSCCHGKVNVELLICTLKRTTSRNERENMPLSSLIPKYTEHMSQGLVVVHLALNSC